MNRPLAAVTGLAAASGVATLGVVGIGTWAIAPTALGWSLLSLAPATLLLAALFWKGLVSARTCTLTGALVGLSMWVPVMGGLNRVYVVGSTYTGYDSSLWHGIVDYVRSDPGQAIAFPIVAGGLAGFAFWMFWKRGDGNPGGRVLKP